MARSIVYGGTNGKPRYTAAQAAEIQRKYGLRICQVWEMHEAQRGRCAVCREKPQKGRQLVIDHCHGESGVRGLLCHECNIALGLMKDSPTRLRAAAEYIVEHRRRCTESEGQIARPRPMLPQRRRKTKARQSAARTNASVG